MAQVRNSRVAIVWLISLSAGVWCAGCSQGDGDGIDGPGARDWARLYNWSDAGTWTDPALWPDEKLRSFAYSGSRGHPDFFREDDDRGRPSYENTISVRREADRWIELATDSPDSALAWSERAARLGAYYRDVVSASETEKYFEFRRVYAENPRDVILSRVHKLSYLDRSMYDRLHPTAVLAVCAVRPLDGPNARTLIEYMWANSRIVDLGRPLSRELVESEAAFTELIYFSYTVFGDWGLCDTIVLGRAAVSVAKATGEVTAEVEDLREVNGVCYE